MHLEKGRGAWLTQKGAEPGDKIQVGGRNEETRDGLNSSEILVKTVVEGEIRRFQPTSASTGIWSCCAEFLYKNCK